MFDFIVDFRKLSVFALLIFFSFLSSGCSDFRQAIGKEKSLLSNPSPSINTTDDKKLLIK